MTDAEINKRIAEHLEPLLTDRTHSDGPYWHWDYKAQHFNPRSFTSDPALSMMLLQKIIELDRYVELYANGNTFYFTAGYMGQELVKSSGSSEIGREIAEAFLKSEGLI